jgi:hypothetical protein
MVAKERSTALNTFCAAVEKESRDWSPGVHCDVGGGYPEVDRGLSKFALEWMVREAELAGLLVDSYKT